MLQTIKVDADVLNEEARVRKLVEVKCMDLKHDHIVQFHRFIPGKLVDLRIIHILMLYLNLCTDRCFSLIIGFWTA